MRGVGGVPHEFLCVEQKLVSKPKACGGKGVGCNEVRTHGMFKIAPSLRRNFEVRVLKKNSCIHCDFSL